MNDIDLSKFRFVEDDVFPETESITLEFKMITPDAPQRNNQQNQIKKRFWDYCKMYSIGFLNANVAGSLLVGILDKEDQPHYIKGIELELHFIDELTRNTDEQLKDILPSVPTSCFSIKLHPIYQENGTKKTDFYVIQFSVEALKYQDFLYKARKRIDGKDCWIKKEKNCISLSEEDGSYNNELKKRHLQVLHTKIEDLDKRLEDKPNDPELLLAKARACSDYGNPVESGKCYEKYIELFPGNQSVRKEYALKFQLDDKDQLQKALNILGIQENDNKLIATVSSNINDYIWCTNTGFFLKKAKRYKDAIHFFNLALKINPKYRKAAYEKKKVYALLYTGRNIK